MTTEELCCKAQDGDTEALEELYRSVYPNLLLTAKKIAGGFNSLFIDKDDLIQEASLGFLRAVKCFDFQKQNQFHTYASTVFENAMMDYIRKLLLVSREEVVLSDTESWDEIAEQAVPENWIHSGNEIYRKTPEEIVIKRETREEIIRSLLRLTERERMYLCYRYGFENEAEQSRVNTAQHFHLSLSRAKKLELEALQKCKNEYLSLQRKVTNGSR